MTSTPSSSVGFERPTTPQGRDQLSPTAQRIALIDDMDRVDLLATAMEARRQESQAIAGVTVAGLVWVRPLVRQGQLVALLPEHEPQSMVR
jgi:hypothetical protein